VTDKPDTVAPADAGGVSNIIQRVLTEIQCNHPHDWTDAVIDEVVARLKSAANHMATIEECLRRVAGLIEATYAHDAGGNRLDDLEPDMSGADCFEAVCQLESAVFEALRLAALRTDFPEQ
jgi:hypothetical protein